MRRAGKLGGFTRARIARAAGQGGSPSLAGAAARCPAPAGVAGTRACVHAATAIAIAQTKAHRTALVYMTIGGK